MSGSGLILHAIETDGPGGAEQMLMRLALEYQRRGTRQLACLLKDGWLADRLRDAGIEVHVEPLRRARDLGWVPRMLRFVRRRQVSAIHSHEFTSSVYMAAVARAAVVPMVATFHGRGFFGGSAVRRAAVRGVSRFASVTAVSNDVRDFLVGEVGVRSDRVTVVRNGVDTDHFSGDVPRGRAFREAHGIGPDDLCVGALGSYYPVKGHRFLVEAMAAVVRVHPAARLLIAGQGELEQALRDQAAGLGLARAVSIIGYQEDPRALLSALDLYVMPSLSEGLPLALLEAASSGCPIVASRVGGIPEVVVDGHSGRLVPPGDPASLSAAITELLGDAPARRSFAANATALVRAHWSLRSAASAYLRLLGLPQCADASEVVA